MTLISDLCQRVTCWRKTARIIYGWASRSSQLTLKSSRCTTFLFGRQQKLKMVKTSSFKMVITVTGLLGSSVVDVNTGCQNCLSHLGTMMHKWQLTKNYPRRRRTHKWIHLTPQQETQRMLAIESAKQALAQHGRRIVRSAPIVNFNLWVTVKQDVFANEVYPVWNCRIYFWYRKQQRLSQHGRRIVRSGPNSRFL